MENKGSNVRYNKINITFPDMVIVENIIPRNMIINLGCASVDNHILRDDIFDYHHIREGNIYILSVTSHINCIVACWPDKRCISHGMCLYRDIKTLSFLNDIVND